MGGMSPSRIVFARPPRRRKFPAPAASAEPRKPARIVTAYKPSRARARIPEPDDAVADAAVREFLARMVRPRG